MIKLDENFTIEHDTFCWTLKFQKENEVPDKKNGGTKKVITKNETYHPSIRSALSKYCDSCLKIDGDASRLIDKINELEGIIQNLNINL